MESDALILVVHVTIVNKNYLKNVMHYEGQVTFGDGIKGEISGIGVLNVPRLPHLNKVMLVQGLKANLISISQL